MSGIVNYVHTLSSNAKCEYDELLEVLDEMETEAVGPRPARLLEMIESIKSEIDRANAYRERLSRKMTRINNVIESMDTVLESKPNPQLEVVRSSLFMLYQWMQAEHTRAKPDEKLLKKSELKREYDLLVECGKLSRAIKAAMKE